MTVSKIDIYLEVVDDLRKLQCGEMGDKEFRERNEEYFVRWDRFNYFKELAKCFHSHLKVHYPEIHQEVFDVHGRYLEENAPTSYVEDD